MNNFLGKYGYMIQTALEVTILGLLLTVVGGV